LVTGSSRGIGAETARFLAANQVKVVVNGRQAEAVERLVAEINASGGAAIGCVADCSKPDQLEGMREQIECQFGAVGLLFAFAGGDGNPEPIEQLTEERWDSVMAGNLKSKFFTVKSFLPGMKRQGAGSIVLMCSAAGRTLSQASLAYSSAHAGVAMLTRNLAQQVGKAGVRVNAIAPSTVMNDKIRKFMPEDQQRSLAASYAIPRLGEPADVAAAALFLSSDASSWITGVVLDVAGGKVML
jgi:3-oxoacyl-[acyl-carrier protein] reductase